METPVEVKKTKTRQSHPKWLIVRNLKDGHVSFSHPDGLGDVTIAPFSERALDFEVWDDVPDLEKLQRMGLIAVTHASRRPASRPSLPLSYELPFAQDKSTAEQIAFSDKVIDGASVADMLINLTPELETPNLAHSKDNRMVDIEYLKQRHVPILEAALWYLDNWRLPWSTERAAQIRERIAVIHRMN